MYSWMSVCLWLLTLTHLLSVMWVMRLVLPSLVSPCRSTKWSHSDTILLRSARFLSTYSVRM